MVDYYNEGSFRLVRMKCLNAHIDDKALLPNFSIFGFPYNFFSTLFNIQQQASIC